MDTAWMQALRDGTRHEIGPLSLQFTGPGERGPEGVCTITSREGVAYSLDWLDAEAIAFCIAPGAKHDLWQAYESDTEPTEAKGKRGWLRLEVVKETAVLGTARAWKNIPFQINRLIMDAQATEVIRRQLGDRTTDYRRECFVRGKGSSKAETRAVFLEACHAISHAVDPTLPEAWPQMALSRWKAADESHSHASEEAATLATEADTLP